MRYKPGDRVRILPFSEIEPPEDVHEKVRMKRDCCCGIGRDSIDELAAKRPYYTVQEDTGRSYQLVEDPIKYLWSFWMLRPYDETEEEPFAEAPEPIFTSLFGVDVEVWR